VGAIETILWLAIVRSTMHPRCNFQANRYDCKCLKIGRLSIGACPHGYTGGVVGIHGFTLCLVPAC
jgi:hypothetical protein